MKQGQSIRRVPIEQIVSLQELFGGLDKNLNWLEQTFGVQLTVREGELVIRGSRPAVERVGDRLEDYARRAKEGHRPTMDDFRTALQLDVGESAREDVRETLDGRFTLAFERKSVSPKSPGQQAYIRAILESSLTFGIGPAGTGKTYLAVACAMDALLRKEVKRIILARPAVEAGESLGFLPGDMYEKVNPYLRPLYDALYDIIDIDRATRMVQRGTIEVAPIAYMRGRTLNDCFVILDEAQNTTSDQMKMFLTRLGFHSKAVVTGDITQVDLPPGKTSGLRSATKILAGIPEIRIVWLNQRDVVRHPLVRIIIDAYEKASEDAEMNASRRRTKRQPAAEWSDEELES